MNTRKAMISLLTAALDTGYVEDPSAVDVINETMDALMIDPMDYDMREREQLRLPALSQSVQESGTMNAVHLQALKAAEAALAGSPRLAVGYCKLFMNWHDVDTALEGWDES